VNLVTIISNSTATLDAGYNPLPGTGGLSSGTPLLVSNAAGSGLRLNDISDITFTYIGKEAGNTNVLIGNADIFRTAATGSGPATSGGAVFTMTEVAEGFLPMNFTSNGALVATNGGTYSNASIAFASVTNDLNFASMYVLLNDPGSDTDYDDLVFRLDIKAHKEDPTQTPIPGGIMLLMSGLAGLGYMGRARLSKKV
jgi:hypothetical protein